MLVNLLTYATSSKAAKIDENYFIGAIAMILFCLQEFRGCFFLICSLTLASANYNPKPADHGMILYSKLFTNISMHPNTLMYLYTFSTNFF